MVSLQQGFHFPDCPLQAHQHRPADNAVADIELVNAGNGRNRLHVAIIQAMAGIDTQIEAAGQDAGRLNLVEFFILRLGTPGVAVAAGVNFDKVGANLSGA